MNYNLRSGAKFVNLARNFQSQTIRKKNDPKRQFKNLAKTWSEPIICKKNGPEWQFANCKWWSLKIWWSSWLVLSWRLPSCSRSDFILHLKLRVQNIFLIIQFLVIYLGRRIMGSSCNVCLIDGEDLKKKLLRGRTLKSVPNSLDFGLNYFNKIWPYQIPFFLLLL